MGRSQLRRAAMVLLVGVFAALVFWLGSRYPDLDAKAAMAGSGSVGDVLSVWPLLEVRPDFALWKKVLYSSINWASDNKKGMTFGVFLGAVFLTLLSYVRLPEARSRLGGAFLGFVVGTPLGVCVNCAAPVMKGVLKSRRVETAFAAMLSSPTMNVVVLTMVFSLFPFYMAVIKVLFALVAVFVVVPVLSMLIGERRVKDLSRVEGDALATCEIPPAPDESWATSVVGAARDLWKSLVFMTVKTVPLMLVAGVLGAFVSHVVPLDALASGKGLVAVVIAAVVGLALPCPIAFDVLLTNALWQQGLPVPITLVLLCTLGIYSVYPFFITWQSASKEWALGLFAFFLVLAVGLGLLGDTLHRVLFIEPNIARYHALVEELPLPEVAIGRGEVAAVKLGPVRGPVPFRRFGELKRARVSRAAFLPKGAASGSFVKREGHELGLVRGFRYSIRDYPDPFWIGRGTAAGDVDGDGWRDLAFGSDTGVILYRNRGGTFEAVPVLEPQVLTMRVYAVAFVDFSGDGRLDLFFSTFNRGSWIVPNVDGHLDFKRRVRLPGKDEVLTVSPAFGDVDGDGRIDIVAGRMALGVITGSHAYSSGRDNAVLGNLGGGIFEERMLEEGRSGETMSTLLSDLDADGDLDLIAGNDFMVPDAFYRGDSKSGFKRTKLVERTPVFSMGMDSGDLDNDLDLDLLLTGTIKRRISGTPEIDGVSYETYSTPKWGADVCGGIRDPVARRNCEVVRAEDDLGPLKRGGSIDVDRCEPLTDTRARQACLLAAMWALVTHNDTTEDCQETFRTDPVLLEVCLLLERKGERYQTSEFAGAAEQEDTAQLYLSDGRGGFSDINAAGPRFVHPGGWTWSTAIVDLDNDGWQDIFNADGTVRKNDFGWNVFMRNKPRAEGGRGFVQRQFSMNLVDDFSLFSFVTLDFDGDGDLDIIGNGSTGPIQVYENQATGENHSIAFSLFDHTSDNRRGIGAKLFIRAEGGQRMMRELKQSGGYQSAQAPVVSFGLGELASVEKLVVVWPEGGKTVVPGPLPADGEYRIERLRRKVQSTPSAPPSP